MRAIPTPAFPRPSCYQLYGGPSSGWSSWNYAGSTRPASSGVNPLLQLDQDWGMVAEGRGGSDRRRINTPVHDAALGLSVGEDMVELVAHDPMLPTRQPSSPLSEKGLLLIIEEAQSQVARACLLPDSAELSVAA